MSYLSYKEEELNHPLYKERVRYQYLLKIKQKCTHLETVNPVS